MMSLHPEALKKFLPKRFQAPPVGITPHDVVHRENKWKLLRYRARPDGIEHRTPILMVPSLINRHYVLDLSAEKSMVSYLVEEGHDVFIIDWGTPGPEDRFLTLDDYCDRAIGRATRVACRLAGMPKLHLLGYCLGGTMTAMHVARRPERIQSHVAIAAPVDFDHAGILGTWTRSETFNVHSLVDALGNIPAPLLQASFYMLKPTLLLWKAANLMDRMNDETFMQGFLATEYWGSDNIPLAGEAFRGLIQHLYKDNSLMRGTMVLGGERIALEDIDCPSAIVTFEHDYIVPKDCATPLLDRIASTDREHIHLTGGHVGAVVSRKARQGLWPQLSRWWQEHEWQEAQEAQVVPASSRPQLLQ